MTELSPTNVGDARTCPACGLMPAAPGDRYCRDCGSAEDRSAWAGDSRD